MEIPDCYDPVYQEERRQAAMDRCADHFPICGCCGHYIYPCESFYELNVRKSILIVCSDCKSEMDENVAIVEDISYDH